jgi:hypothetical protein
VNELTCATVGALYERPFFRKSMKTGGHRPPLQHRSKPDRMRPTRRVLNDVGHHAESIFIQ